VVVSCLGFIFFVVAVCVSLSSFELVVGMCCLPHVT
jgi:hypothetical protein